MTAKWLIAPIALVVVYEFFYYSMLASCVTSVGQACVYWLTLPQLPGLP